MDILSKLNELVVSLYSETAGYLDDQADAQLWYNRGYANGVVAVLREQNLADELAARINLDEAGLHHDDHFMAWTKAYHHGFEMGDKEAREVLIK
ncbi:MAG: hypothetical protein HUJ30_05315 [Gammaproteobacteria bacterium]|nr:hypothetical protein [Gammaproteobacteria bacterium]